MDLIDYHYDKIIEFGQIISFINTKYYFVCITLQSEFKHFQMYTVDTIGILVKCIWNVLLKKGPMLKAKATFTTAISSGTLSKKATG